MASRMGATSQAGRRWLQLTSLILLVSPHLFGLSLAQNCGSSGPCASGFCCSKWGYCGNTDTYCGAGCVSQCPGTPSPTPPSPTPPSPGPPGPSSPGVGGIFTSSLYDQIFPNGNSFYTYDSFIEATQSFSSFGATGSSDQQKQDVAAFLAHVSHETAGLVYINEVDQSGNYCESSDTQYPCVSGQLYYGRGPMQISWNYNYGACAAAINEDILNNPGLVATDPVISWKTSLWFWTSAQSPKPACEAVMDGTWTPSQTDIAAGRQAGFGETIVIVNGGIECGPGAAAPSEAADRVTQYTNICGQLGVSPGSNTDCTTMQPY